MDDPQLAAFKTKRIQVYRNGDAFSPPKTIIVNHRLFKNWEQLLRHIATEVSLGGAVRRLFTLAEKSGTPGNDISSSAKSAAPARIIQALADFKYCGLIVAAATNEPYKRIPYGANPNESAATAAAERLLGQRRPQRWANPLLMKNAVTTTIQQDLDEGIFDADVCPY